MRLAPVGLVALLAVPLACSTDDGRDTFPPPRPDQTLSIVTTSTTTVTPSFEPSETLDTTDADTSTLLELTLPFADGQPIDARYTCDGDDLSPSVGWRNVPEGTTELALSVIDLDSDPPGFVHWAITGIDPATAGLAEGATPDGAVQAANGFGRTGWGGPCPPEGGPHTYLFTLYALDGSPGFADGADGSAAITAIESRAVQTMALAGTYGG